MLSAHARLQPPERRVVPSDRRLRGRIPEAGHHLMLDQPLLLITALNTLLADWEHSEPLERCG